MSREVGDTVYRWNMTHKAISSSLPPAPPTGRLRRPPGRGGCGGGGGGRGRCGGGAGSHSRERGRLRRRAVVAFVVGDEVLGGSVVVLRLDFAAVAIIIDRKRLAILVYSWNMARP